VRKFLVLFLIGLFSLCFIGCSTENSDPEVARTSAQTEAPVAAQKTQKRAQQTRSSTAKSVKKPPLPAAEILNWSWEYETLGENCFINWRAEVQNNCSKTKAVEVKVSFYDSSGRVLAFHTRGVWSKVPPHGTDTIGGGMNYSCSKPKPTSAKARILDVSDPL